MSEIRTSALSLSQKSWKTFTLIVSVYPELPRDVFEKIRISVYRDALHQDLLEEIRNKYLKGLPEILTSSKLNMSLESIINGIEEREGLLKARVSLSNDICSRCEGCDFKGQCPRRWCANNSLLFHPGRISLLNDLDMCPRRSGGRQEAIEYPNPIEMYGGRILMDRIYFSGGRPLIPWRSPYDDSIGLKICPPDIDQGERHLMLEEYAWKNSKQLINFAVLLPHLPDEWTFWAKKDDDNPRSVNGRFHEKPWAWDQGRPIPRTYMGSHLWRHRHKGGKIDVCPEEDGYNDPYAWFIQSFEDVDMVPQSMDWWE